MANGQIHGPADLHLHSSRSDGTEPPEIVMRSARAFGLRTVALTDHDTTAGWADAAPAAVSLGMTLIPGMELSSQHAWRSVHLLAYLFDPDDPALAAETARIRNDRRGRAERIVASLSRDYDLTWADVVAQTVGDATVGRPHIADALVARGIVADRSAAFDGVLHPREGYYEPHYAPDPATAVRLVVAAGGVPIIAHPTPAGRDRMMPLPYIEELIGLGLAGFEIDHRENTEAGKRVLRDLARRHDLIVTGSSDYHGAGKPNRPGENTTSDEMVARIVERGTGSAPVIA
ncbi:PHP domain-containing protein [Microbacterium sp. cx-55]|uniref:PHP domain-containing protein n=1 Tax=unclassified Microbacterium TaxID=2609290 RepID=UPI001CBDE1E3|nr:MULTISPECIES: PHP domain-containing protein [unclassified Microbacterium]MBZ4485913.1 PHP domain-containing protein [Microbacterium sp. cx-55]MCC4906874.1 PHP domain-containing protein [Microbacterium sp. cx-59]UGB34211.1 PHP domain-containing protein [Microbacterium sp. cx-55]